MAMRIEAGDFGRSDLFHVLPENLIVNESLNGRFQGHDEEAVEEIAQSLLAHGQLQAVVVRRLPDKRLQLVAGYRRWKAAQLINTKLRPDDPFKLQCRVVEMNEEESFLSNIIENHDRRDCNDLDYAFQHRRLREEHGWDDGRIAALYRRSAGWVSQKRKLLQLDNGTREQLARGDLTTNAALDVVGLPSEERSAVVKAATDEGGKVDTGKVRTAVRERGEKKARSLSELKKFLTGFTSDDSTDKQRELATHFLAYIAGTLSDRQMTKRLETILE